MLVATFIALIIPSMSSGRIIYSHLWGMLPVMTGLIAGYQIITFLHCRIPHLHLLGEQPNGHIPQRFNRMSLIIIAICLHNIPEGLSVGVGFGGNDIVNAISLGIAISIQNIPEGLVVALGLLSMGATKHRAVFVAFLSGMVEPVAALLGFVTTQLSHYILPFALAFAGGAMLNVVCQEMFPELFREKQMRHVTTGLLAGVICMLIIDYFVSS